MTRRSSAKFPATAAADPYGPRLLPIKSKDSAIETAFGLTGYSWVSLADTAMKIWDSPDDKNERNEPARHRR